MRETDFYVVVPEGVLDLGPYHVAVYCALRAFADNQSDECWPSHKTLSERARVSLDKTKRVLKDLRDAGWIGWVERRQPNGSLTSNRYQVYGSKQGAVGASVTHISTDPSPAEKAEGSPVQKAEGSPADKAGVGADKARELIPNELLPNRNYRVAPDGDDATRLASLFSELLTDLGVRHRVSEQWVTDLDRMMRLDGRTPEEVEGAMRWALADDFWSANIHSPKKLRAKFDQMRLQAKRGNGKSNARKALDLAAHYQRLEEAGL